MSQLDDQIRLWGEQLRRTQQLTDDNVEELTDHLRQSVADLEACGLDSTEAFLIAARRLGSPNDLGCEFGNVNRAFVWRRRAIWMLVGTLAMHVLRTLVVTSAMAAQAGAALWSTSATTLALIWLAVVLGGVILVAAAAWFDSGWTILPGWRPPRVSAAFLGGGLLFATLAAQALQHGAQVVLLDQLTIEQFGTLATVQAIAARVLALLWPILLLALVVKLRNRQSADWHIGGVG